MQVTKYIIALFSIATFFSSCEKVFMKPKPQADALAIFDEYDKIVTEKYAMLDFKGVDIDMLTDSLRTVLASNPNPTETNTFEILSNITARLRDGHSSLIGVADDVQYAQIFDVHAGYPRAFDAGILYSKYINPSGMKTIGGQTTVGEPDAVYGKLAQDPEIGYLRIPIFVTPLTDNNLETIFTELKGTKGMILDLRGNSGGDPALATRLSSYFMSTATYTGIERFKTGPGKNDFSDTPTTVEPADSDNRYTGKVAVLTDRGVFSATLVACYSLNPLEQVTFIGQRAGGGSGSVADGFLANGWVWSLSVSEFIDSEGRRLDDGFDPDIQVMLDLEDTSKDEIVERAILELQ